MFRKPHIPLVPRTATYSCSLANRSPRKRTASTQTEQCPLAVIPNPILKEDAIFNEEASKTYSTALEYVNSVHAYMNKKLSEKYGECGDTKPDGSNFFKLPEVPNYSGVFVMLLEKTRVPKLATNGIAVKKKWTSLKPELQPKKYAIKDNVIGFVLNGKKSSEYKLLEVNGGAHEMEKTEQGVQTVVSHQLDDGCATKTVLPSFCSTNNSNSRTAPLEEEPESKNRRVNMEENIGPTVKKTSHPILNVQETDKKENVAGDENEISDASTVQRSEEHSVKSENKGDDKVIMMEIIKKRVQEEIVTYIDRANASLAKNQRPRLMSSNFHVVSIPPQINLLEYAQKKLERQLTSEPRHTACHETFQKQFFNDNLSAKPPPNVRPDTPIKVTNMFRKLSQENFKNLDTDLDGDLLKRGFDNSDGDSVILDDEEFEKINGHLGEEGDKKQRGNCSGGKEKSNPLKLTVRDMSKLNEKVLNTIGIFTERGDIRPEVIDILEEQKKTKAMDSRNKQFRSRRQWDLQIHLNPKENINASFTSVSSEKSFTSLSSTDKSEFNTVTNVSQQVEYDQ